MTVSPRVGDAVVAMAFPAITREQLQQYAEASGDPNPIHLDDEAARKFGLPGVIAHGMLSAAFVAERAERYVGQEFPDGSRWKLGEFQVRFKAMVFPGDVLSISGTLKEVTDQRLVLELQARNAKGEVTTTGLAQYSR